MDHQKIIKNAIALSHRYRVDNGEEFHLDSVDPDDTRGFGSEDKPRARQMLEDNIKLLAHLQEMLYAEGFHSLLAIMQGIDGAGKDGIIKHVMSGVNPQGCEVNSFTVPSAEELLHDFMWRCVRLLPRRGRIGIFNRSYYEETLVVRVHPELLKKQKLPPELITEDIWKERYRSIRDFERHLDRNGTSVCKFFLHISKKEQKKRFLTRLDDPAKNWKFSSADIRERSYWNDYQRAFEDTIRHTASQHAPWYVVPADNKWFARLVVSSALISRLASMKIKLPENDPERARDLAAARLSLLKKS